MTTTIVYTNTHNIVEQAHTDDQLIDLWLHSKTSNSQKAYQRDVDNFMAFVGKPLHQVTLADLQAFMDSLTGSPNSSKRTISAVKSLFSFGQKIGYLQFNVGAAIKAPKPKNTLAERILTEAQFMEMLALTTKQRDRVLLRLLYASAGRVSEVASLCWRDCRENGDSGQVTLFGKGDETRVVKLSAATWKELIDIKPADVDRDEPVFRSQKGGAMDITAIWRVVKAAGERVGVDGVSPHWLRHSHASHALDRGASVALVRDTLGHSTVAITSKYLHAKPGESSALHLAV